MNRINQTNLVQNHHTYKSYFRVKNHTFWNKWSKNKKLASLSDLVCARVRPLSINKKFISFFILT